MLKRVLGGLTCLAAVCGLLLSGRHYLSHNSATNTFVPKPARKSKLGQAEAIELALHLHLDTREEDARIFLERHGLVFSLSFGDSFGWYDSFPLTNGVSLLLDIRPREFRADGAWADGLVKGVVIQSNGVEIISIALTNRPQK